jgi:hypothetical protein
VNAVVDGSLGVAVEIPPDWKLLLGEASWTSWETPQGLGVTITHRPERLMVDPFLLDDFRQDLRLLVARRGGGLITCRLQPAVGVEGVTKEPQRWVGRGSTYRGYLLIPTAQGRCEVEVVAHEGQVTGEREAAVIAEEFEGQRPLEWSADPYGYLYQSDEDAPLPTHRYPSGLSLGCPADDPGYDLLFPKHALTKIRELLGELRLRVVAPCDLRVPRGRSAVEGARFFRPLGFLQDGVAPGGRGQRYHRVGFRGSVAQLWVAHHSEAANQAIDARAARERLGELLAGAASAPRSRRVTFGSQSGLRVEYETPDAGFGVVFFLPWADHVLEIHRRGPPDDWARSREDIRSVVLSLDERVSSLGRTPGGTRALVSPKGLRRVFRILCWLAWCDSELVLPEVELLETLREEYGLSQADASQLMEEAKRGESLRVGRRAAERELLLTDLVGVAAADGVLDPAQQRGLELLAPQLGYRYADLVRQIQEALE